MNKPTQEKNESKINILSVIIALLSLIVAIISVIYFDKQLTENRKMFNKQLKDNREMFILLNQGYLDINIKTNLARDDIPGLISLGTNQMIADNNEFQAVQFDIELHNQGDLPLWYELKGLEIKINNILNYPFGKEPKTHPGIVFPKQEGLSISCTIYIDQSHKQIPFKEIKKLSISGNIKIKYKTNSVDNSQYLIRNFTIVILGNGARTIRTWTGDEISGVSELK